jgi:microcystin-dependent protein
MGEPYIGEIRMVGFSFPPNGWAFCDGQLMAISQNDALFTLIGTTYGGDGQETFALPNLQSRMPVHSGQGPGTSNYVLGEMGGSESVTLTIQQIPTHNHPLLCSNVNGTQSSPNNGMAAASTQNQFAGPAGPQPMNNTLVQGAGGGQPHENMMPFLVISFCISLFGVFPQQT